MTLISVRKFLIIRVKFLIICETDQFRNTSGVEIGDFERVADDEIAAGFDDVAHQG